MNLTAQSLRDEFLGRVCLTNPDDPSCLLNQRLARLFPIIVDPRYVLWMFKSKVFRAFVGSLNTGSLIQHMFTTQLEGFCLPLPPLSEQVRIVAQIDRQLSSVHAVEGQAKHNTGRLLALRQTILRWAFEGKLADQDPNDEPASALLERIKAKGKQADGSRRTKKPVVRKVA
jgi:type I restriction enzyme S subunit